MKIRYISFTFVLLTLFAIPHLWALDPNSISHSEGNTRKNTTNNIPNPDLTSPSISLSVPSAPSTTSTNISATTDKEHPQTSESIALQSDPNMTVPYPVFIMAEPRPSQASIEIVKATIEAAEAKGTSFTQDVQKVNNPIKDASINELQVEAIVATPHDQAAVEAVHQQAHLAKSTHTPVALTPKEVDGKIGRVGSEEERPEGVSDSTVSNSIVAVVDNRPITLYEVFEQMAPVIPQVQKESHSQAEFTQKLSILQRQALDNIIDGILIIKYFESKKFQIPENVIDNEINEFIQTRYNGDKGALIKDLQKAGKSFRKFKEEMKERIIIQAMQDRMLKTKSHVSPEKIRAYYLAHLNEFEQEPAVEISQITLKGSPEERAELAQTIEAALKAGQKFSDLAKQYSQDQKASSGGYWGWIPKNSLRPELAGPIFQLQPHQFSKPIETGDRTYIIYVSAKKFGGARPIEEVQSIIEEKVSREMARESYNEWLQQLRSRAYIRYMQDSKQP